MAKAKFVQKGGTIDYTNGGASAIAYNDVVPLATRISVAGETIAVGATGSLHTEGVFEIPSVNDASFAVGDQLYWDNTAGKLTKVSAGNIAAGWCVETKATAGTVAKVKIG